MSIDNFTDEDQGGNVEWMGGDGYFCQYPTRKVGFALNDAMFGFF